MNAADSLTAAGLRSSDTLAPRTFPAKAAVGSGLQTMSEAPCRTSHGLERSSTGSSSALFLRKSYAGLKRSRLQSGGTFSRSGQKPRLMPPEKLSGEAARAA